MLSVNKVIGKLTKIVKSLEQVSEVNRDTVGRKRELIYELEEESAGCLAEAERADKITKKFKELLEL